MSNDKWGVGDKKDSPAFRTILINNREIELIHGEYPHSRSDNNIYARFSDGSIKDFDGHQILTGIKFQDYNYLKESGLSGNEVRKGGTCVISFDNIDCYEFFYRDILSALIKAHQKILHLREHPSGWPDKLQRAKLIGRSVWVRGIEYKIKRLIEDQGCLILVPPIHYDEMYDFYSKREVDDPVIEWYDCNRKD